MFSKGCHVIGEHALMQELQAERKRQMPVVPERPYAEMNKAQPQVAAFRQPHWNPFSRRMNLR